MIVQPDFWVHLSIEETLQEASKSSYKCLTCYYFLTCTDAKRDIWEDALMTESNTDDKSIERRNAGRRLTTTGGGMYKLAF